MEDTEREADILVRKEEMKRLTEQCHSLCFHVFGTPEGQKLLHELRKFLMNNKVTADPRQDASWAFFNEGQKELVRNLEGWYEAGKQAYEASKNNDKVT